MPGIYDLHSSLPFSCNHVVSTLSFRSGMSPYYLCVFTCFSNVQARITSRLQSSGTDLTIMNLMVHGVTITLVILTGNWEWNANDTELSYLANLGKMAKNIVSISIIQCISIIQTHRFLLIYVIQMNLMIIFTYYERFSTTMWMLLLQTLQMGHYKCSVASDSL